jgi:radical SAM protein with 4Fe4S-binding SPASM domain
LKTDKNIESENELDMENMIGLFKKLADNPVSSHLLKRTLNYCKKDNALKLESSLNYYLGKKENVCNSCKLLSKVIGYIIEKGANSFGMSVDELKTTMNDDYWVRGLASVIKGIAIFGVKKPFIPGAPFQVVWNITKNCNMRCVHCYEDASVKGKDELSRDQILESIDVMAKAGVTSIAFSGGEPTLHPNILDFIKYVDDNGMFPAIATNGYIFKDQSKAKKFVDEGLEFVQISLDGINPSTHDSFRKINGAWERAVEAIKNFVELGIFVEVATTVTEHNIDEIHDMIYFLRDLGIDWFMLYNFIPTGKGSEILDLDLSPKERKDLLTNAYKENTGDMQILSTAPQYAAVAENLASNNHLNNYNYNNNTNGANGINNINNTNKTNNNSNNYNETEQEHIDNPNIIPTHFYNPEYSNPMIAQLADFIGGCGAGRFYINLEPNGDIYPCVFFPHEEEVKLGNILVDNFEEIWKEEPLLSKLRDKKILKGHCGKCDSRNTCGGCRARAYNYFNDILAPDPGCTNNQNEWNALKSKLSGDNSLKVNYLTDESLILDLKRW